MTPLPPDTLAIEAGRPPLPVQRLLTTAEAAEYLGLAENTLRIARVRGTGPVYHKFGRTVRYAVDDLVAHAEQSKRKSTSQAA